ncbi:hypothetical protein [Marimonas arenosa]|uniref:Uncharacterized protein n=1 Tax=Marimonas arenosa TaxID=1795305 RepID=A0AAE3WH04_9RHOB|nr:hypothetical protein [Marimonas arenosa]MDQ2091540.1 hypothetical protein [Marimonas arenosa]
MKRVQQKILTGLVTGFFALAAIATGLAAQTLEGSNIDSRVLVGFEVDAEDVQSRLPEGWTSVSFPNGALKGANLLMIFEDRVLGRDAEGKPLDLFTHRGLAFLGLAKQGDSVRLYILRLYTTNPDYDPYRNASVADISRMSSTSGPSNAGRDRSENWSVALGDGTKLEMTLTFTSGRPVWQNAKTRMFSNADPTVSRIFEYDQLMDVVMSTGLGKPLSGTMNLTSDIAELADIFDGNEKMVGIVDSPIRVRQVFLP